MWLTEKWIIQKTLALSVQGREIKVSWSLGKEVVSSVILECREFAPRTNESGQNLNHSIQCCQRTTVLAATVRDRGRERIFTNDRCFTHSSSFNCHNFLIRWVFLPWFHWWKNLKLVRICYFLPDYTASNRVSVIIQIWVTWKLFLLQCEK